MECGAIFIALREGWIEFSDEWFIGDGEFFVRGEEASESDRAEACPWEESVEENVDPSEPPNILGNFGGFDVVSVDIAAFIGAILDFNPGGDMVVVEDSQKRAIFGGESLGCDDG